MKLMNIMEMLRNILLIGGCLQLFPLVAQLLSSLGYVFPQHECGPFLAGSHWHRGQPAPLIPPG